MGMCVHAQMCIYTYMYIKWSESLVCVCLEPTWAAGGVPCTLPVVFWMLLHLGPEVNSGCQGWEWRKPGTPNSVSGLGPGWLVPEGISPGVRAQYCFLQGRCKVTFSHL